MDLGLKGKVTMVAGSSSGLGKATALAFAKEGSSIAINGRNEKTLKATAVEIREKTGQEIFPVTADLTKSEQIRLFAEKTHKAFGRIDILVNNCGGPAIKPFIATSEDEWWEGIKLTLMSSVLLTKAVIPFMMEQKYGRIVNITSVSVKQPMDNFSISGTRAGIIGYSKTLASELAKYNILINNVCPGYTRTERLEEVFKLKAEQRGISVDEAIREIEKEIPLGRIGEPSELADLIVFLCSQRASYITGTTIQVDGGRVRSLF